MSDIRSILHRPQPTARALLLAMASVLASIPAMAQNILTIEEQEYTRCMQQTRIDAEGAFERALQWQDIGGGLPAQHCAATALMLLGQYAQAAERFEQLAWKMPNDASNDLVADILAHAGIAWFEANDLDQAYAMQSAALELVPNAPMILVDRAMVLAQLNQFDKAIIDLNRAIEIDPSDPVPFTMRASAYRFLDANDQALADAEEAMRLDPRNPEALLERGIIRRLMGDVDGARKDWLRLIELHDGRPAADSARRNLERLDVNTN